MSFPVHSIISVKANLSIDFYQRVYALVGQIPHGRVTTYGAIAETLGHPKASRTVGYALNQVHGRYHYENLPAHRVVNRNGVLTGKNHFETPTRMQELLALEGVIVADDCVRDFDRLFWHPKELLGSSSPKTDLLPPLPLSP